MKWSRSSRCIYAVWRGIEGEPRLLEPALSVQRQAARYARAATASEGSVQQ